MSLSEQLRWDSGPTDEGGWGEAGAHGGADWRYPWGGDTTGGVAGVVVAAVVSARVDAPPAICRRDEAGRSGGLSPPTLPPPPLAPDSRRLREELVPRSPGNPSSDGGPRGGEPAPVPAPPSRRPAHTQALYTGGDAALNDGGRLTDPTRPSQARLVQHGDVQGRQPEGKHPVMGDAEWAASSGSSDDKNVAAANASVDDDDAVSVDAPPSAKYGWCSAARAVRRRSGFT